MKRSFYLILCVILVALVAVFAAGCNQPPEESETQGHTHAYSEDWSTDANNHWHAATCGCANEKANLGAHADANKDGKCDTCQYVVCAHTYADAWSTNGTHHWHAATCECDVKKDYAEHKDTNEDGICDVCDGVVCAHTYATELSKNKDGHWYAATCGCDVKGNYEAHNRVVSQSGSVCGDCDYVTCTGHTYDSNYTADKDGHFQAATCGCDYEKNRNEHYDENDDGICDIEGCAWSDPTHLHTFNGDLWEKNANYHWHPATCEHSGAIMLLDHVDMDKDNVCDACEQVMCYHRYASGWEYNETHHWEPADCGCEAEPINFGTHVDANNDGACDVCLKGHTAKEIHKSFGEGSATFTDVVLDFMTDYYTPIQITVQNAGTYIVLSQDERVYMSAVDYDYNYGVYSVTFTADKAGTYTVYGAMPGWVDVELDNGEYTFDYSVISMEPVTINTSHGSAILPGGAEVEITFVAPAAGVWIISSPVELLEWGSLVYDDWSGEYNWEYDVSNPYITLEASKAGEKVVFRVKLPGTEDYTFEWTVEEMLNFDIVADKKTEVRIPYGFMSTLTFTPDVTGIYQFSAGYDTTWFGKYNEEYGYLAWSYGNVAEYILIAGKTYTLYLTDYSASVDAVDHVTVTLLEEVEPEPETIEVEEGDNEITVPAGGAYISFLSYANALYSISNVSTNGFIVNDVDGIKVTGNSAWFGLGYTASADFEVGEWTNYTFFVQNNSDEAITVSFTITFLEEIIPEVYLGENTVQYGQYVFTAPADGVYCISTSDMYTTVYDRTMMWFVTGNSDVIAMYPSYSYYHNLEMKEGDQILLMVEGRSYMYTFSITEGADSGYTGPEGGGSDEPVASDLVLGENSVDVTDGFAGVKLTFVAEVDGTYTISTDGSLGFEDAYGIEWLDSKTVTLGAGQSVEIIVCCENFGETGTVTVTVEML